MTKINTFKLIAIPTVGVGAFILYNNDLFVNYKTDDSKNTFEIKKSNETILKENRIAYLQMHKTLKDKYSASLNIEYKKDGVKYSVFDNQQKINYPKFEKTIQQNNEIQNNDDFELQINKKEIYSAAPLITHYDQMITSGETHSRQIYLTDNWELKLSGNNEYDIYRYTNKLYYASEKVRLSIIKVHNKTKNAEKSNQFNDYWKRVGY